MTLLGVFAGTLLAAVLLSELASRSVLSTSLVFLAAGLLAGPVGLGWVSLEAGSPGVGTLVEVALFAVLFTDGMRTGAADLRRAWRMPGRALLFGLPLALLGTAFLAHTLVGLAWPAALLLGAVLAPTDPVFASAILGREEVPWRLRHLLHVESGVNDGLALPVVLVLLAGMAGAPEAHAGSLVAELALGVALGAALPAAVLWLESRSFLASHEVYEPLLAFSIALLLFAGASQLHANAFLAAFAGGVTVATLSQKARADFHRFGEIVAELLKLAALLAFGAFASPELVTGEGAGTLLFVALVLAAVRPLAIGLALAGSPLPARERLAAAWFGPKGFASVVYALLVLQTGVAAGERVYHLTVLVVAVSIVAHSSTDVLVARWLRAEAEPAPERPAGPGG